MDAGILINLRAIPPRIYALALASQLTFSVFLIVNDTFFVFRSLPLGFDDNLTVAIKMIYISTVIAVLGSPISFALMSGKLQGLISLMSLPFGVVMLIILELLLVAVRFPFTIRPVVLFLSGLIVALLYRKLELKPIRLRIFRLNSLILMLVYVLPLAIFVRFIYLYGSSPIGDLLFHNQIIAEIVGDRTLMPASAFILPSGLPYPLLYHMLGAALTELLGMPPAVSSLYAGAVISVSLLYTVYGITYILTDNYLVSAIAMALAAYVPNNVIVAPWTSNDISIGNFINGTYPQHLANLLLLLGIFVFILVMKLQRANFAYIQARQYDRFFPYIVLWVLCLFAVLSNPRLHVLALGLLAFSLFLRYKGSHVLQVVSAYLIVYLIMPLIFGNYSASSFFVGPLQSWAETQEVIGNHLLLILVVGLLSAFGLVILFYKKREQIRECVEFFFLYYVSTAFLVLVGFWYPLFNSVGWFLFSSRAILVEYVLSIILMCGFVARIRKPKANLITVSLLTVVGILATYQYTGFALHEFSGFNVYGKPVEADYLAIKTILNDSRGSATVLADPNFLGYYISSYSARVSGFFDYILDRRLTSLDKTLINESLTQNRDYYIKRFQMFQIYTNELECSTVIKLIVGNNVTYVYVTSMPTILDNQGEWINKNVTALNANLACLGDHATILYDSGQVKVYKIRRGG